MVRPSTFFLPVIVAWLYWLHVRIPDRDDARPPAKRVPSYEDLLVTAPASVSPSPPPVNPDESRCRAALDLFVTSYSSGPDLNDQHEICHYMNHLITNIKSFDYDLFPALTPNARDIMLRTACPSVELGHDIMKNQHQHQPESIEKAVEELFALNFKMINKTAYNECIEHNLRHVIEQYGKDVMNTFRPMLSPHHFNDTSGDFIRMMYDREGKRRCRYLDYTHLLYSKILGDNLQLPLLVAALLNPSGGIIGPGDSRLASLFTLAANYCTECDGLSLYIHSAAHDAYGLIYNTFNHGPGYRYACSCESNSNITAVQCQQLSSDVKKRPCEGQKEGLCFIASLRCPSSIRTCGCKLDSLLCPASDFVDAMGSMVSQFW